VTLRSRNVVLIAGGYWSEAPTHTNAFSKEVICAGGRDAPEAQLGLPSEAEEASGRLTASIAHRYNSFDLKGG